MRMKKNFKVFVADVDGTLRSRTVRIPQKETIQAFEKMHQEGMIVGIASGRPLWQGLKDHHKEWKLSFQFDFLIGMNGGEIWEKSTNKTTQYNPLTVEQLKGIVETSKISKASTLLCIVTDMNYLDILMMKSFKVV